MKITKTLFLTLTFLNVANATPTGEELTKSKCASCHILEVPTPEQIVDLKAPAINAVLFHLKLDHYAVNAQKAFIMDYALNPHASKSVCESNKVQKFGVMPSLKGVVTKEELEKIADHLIATYPKSEFVSMIQEIQTNGKMNALKSSPFLLNQEEFPHLTKILIENWDKAKLGLNDEQKTKLLVVRKETMSGVKKIKKLLKPLEESVLEMMYDEEELSNIQAKIEKIAKLKAQASGVHMKCIKDTLEILTEDQREFIVPFWDN